MNGARSYHTAFGETKFQAAWAKDPRCVVSESRLSERLTQGWDFEAALTTPNPPRSNDPSWIEAFGEVKTLNQWARDPRCPVTVGGLGGRLKRGWSPEEAISSPPGRNRGCLYQFREATGFANYPEYAASLPHPTVKASTFWGRYRRWGVGSAFLAATAPLLGEGD